ncbi:MAG: LacI family DNA-binding transcriptional regulator [Spirochaetota bacterium]
MTSIKDIAKMAGVSASTVSRAINNKQYVKPDIRDKIMALVKKTGYVPDGAARSMVLGRTFTVGIVIPDTFNMFQRQLFSTIEHCLEGHGYRTSFFFVKWEPESESRCLMRLKAQKLDGVIMMHEVGEPEFYDYLAASGMPVVLCTFERPETGLPSIHVAEEEAAKAATRHLISLGHRNIGLISGQHFSFGTQRAAGYRSALEGAGISAVSALSVLVPSYSADDGRAGMRSLLSRKTTPTAVFAATDELAIGAIRALHEAGLKVPDDVSVIGFDDIDISDYLVPALTTVSQPIHDMGRTTAEMMSDLISGEDRKRGVAPFGHRLVIRESCAAPRTG